LRTPVCRPDPGGHGQRVCGVPQKNIDERLFASLSRHGVGGKCYVIGGRISYGPQGLSMVEEDDPATNSWSRSASLPTARFGLAARVANDRIYAIGGADGLGAVDDVTAYDPKRDQWTSVSPLRTRRTRFASASIGNRIYALGGTLNFDVPHVGMDLV
jgi:N-acetylneuraminic acid mutarotase